MLLLAAFICGLVYSTTAPLQSAPGTVISDDETLVPGAPHIGVKGFATIDGVSGSSLRPAAAAIALTPVGACTQQADGHVATALVGR